MGQGWEGEKKKEGFIATCKCVHQSFRSYRLHLRPLASQLFNFHCNPLNKEYLTLNERMFYFWMREEEKNSFQASIAAISLFDGSCFTHKLE